MAGSRYSLIPKAFWQYLGPAYRGLDADLEAVESAVADGGGGGGGALGSLGNPYINPADPATLPEGSYYVVYDPTNLTYQSNRFGGGAVGDAITDVTSAATGNLLIENWYDGEFTFTDQNTMIGNRAALYKAPAAAGWAPVHSTAPAGQSEARIHVLMRMPALAAGATMTVLRAVNAPSTGMLGDVTLSGDGSWSCSGTSSAPGVLPPAGTPIRVALRLDTVVKTIGAAIFAGDSNNVIGFPIVLPNADVGSTDLTIGNVHFGAVTGSGYGGTSFVIGAVRAGYGPGAGADHLQPESTYSA